MTPEEYIALAPSPMQAVAYKLRNLVKIAIPDVIENFYPGWKLIGYRIPDGKKSHYLGYLYVSAEKVSLGFERGSSIDDPYGLLVPTGKQVREVRFDAYSKIDNSKVLHLIKLGEETVLFGRKK